MVVFTCNSCGESVKKNHVEKHVFRCRQCMVLSCVDCGKDFSGVEYKTHTICGSEKEKCSGENVKPKSNAKKEEKQEEWVKILKKNLNESDVKPSVKELFERILKFESIPKKEQKFKNFITKGLSIKDEKLANEAWILVSKARESLEKPKLASKTKSPSENGKAADTNNGEKMKKRRRSQQERQEKKRLSQSDLQTKDEMEQEDQSAEMQQPDDIELGSRMRKRKTEEKIIQTPLKKTPRKTRGMKI